jgi:hypothetical protein
MAPLMQAYPRDEELLLKLEYLPKQNPVLSIEGIDDAIREAFARTKKQKAGKQLEVPKEPEELAELCLKHLRERSDPIVSPFFFSQMKVEDVFDMDAISHEMQRQRMKIGVFYQYLMIELMKRNAKLTNSNFVQAFDGAKEGDAVADIRTPKFSDQTGLRLYMSIKKSEDTVGGQDIGGVIRRIEKVAKDDKNLTSPYLCVIAIGTPAKGKIKQYESGRYMRKTKDGNPYSFNCEIWLPEFIFPYVTGQSPILVYKESMKLVKEYLPFYTLDENIRKEAASILGNKLRQLGIADENGDIDIDKFFDYVVKEA